MSEAFLPNATIDGRFRIRSVIGAGTFGMVYAADDLRDGGFVALKTLHEKVKRQDEYLLRFEREADVTRKLSHPSITRLVAAGHLDEEGGVTTPYLAFELIRGLPLSRLLEARGPLSACEAVHLTATLLAALSAAHQQGILHRDLKPDNILVAAPDNLITEPQAGGSLSMRLGIPELDHESWSDLRSHTVKVLDFGLAKILDIGQGRVKALTKAGFAPGTAHYMSPEQVRGTSDLDYRADLYAVGLLLYRMLSGEEAFPGDNAMEVISLQLGAPTPALPSTHADELNRVVQRATAKNPADRFSSADEMAWAMKCAHNPILRSGPAPTLVTPPPLSKPSLLRRLFGG